MSKATSAIVDDLSVDYMLENLLTVEDMLFVSPEIFSERQSPGVGPNGNEMALLRSVPVVSIEKWVVLASKLQKNCNSPMGDGKEDKVVNTAQHCGFPQVVSEMLERIEMWVDGQSIFLDKRLVSKVRSSLARLVEEQEKAQQMSFPNSEAQKKADLNCVALDWLAEFVLRSRALVGCVLPSKEDVSEDANNSEEQRIVEEQLRHLMQQPVPTTGSTRTDAAAGLHGMHKAKLSGPLGEDMARNSMLVEFLEQVDGTQYLLERVTELCYESVCSLVRYMLHAIQPIQPEDVESKQTSPSQASVLSACAPVVGTTPGYVLQGDPATSTNKHKEPEKKSRGIGKQSSSKTARTTARWQVSINKNHRLALKNLAGFLGRLTIGQNKPLKSKILDVKKVLLAAFTKGRLSAVVPGVCRILENASCSKVFKVQNPWTMAMLSLLAEIHDLPYLKSSVVFEVELLCKHLEVKIAEVRRSDHDLRQKKPESMRDFQTVGSKILPAPPQSGCGVAVGSGPGELPAPSSGKSNESAISDTRMIREDATPPPPPPPAPASDKPARPG